MAMGEEAVQGIFQGIKVSLSLDLIIWKKNRSTVLKKTDGIC